jgi:hypothetical protein
MFCDTITSAQLYKLLCKQCVFVAAYTICSKYGCWCMDILILYCDHIEYTQMMDLPLVDVSVLVCHVLSRGVYWAMWRVVSLMLTRKYSGLGSLAFCSSISLVVELACKRTPSSSYSFPYCMFCFGFPYSCLLLMCNVYVEIGLFWYILYVHSIIFYRFQFGQHMICYMFCIVIYILCLSLFCLVVSCRIIGCMLHALNGMFNSVLLNKLVTLCVSGL